LGASRAQILRVLLVEYISLGLLAALTGILLATAASWGLSVWVFKMPFAPPVWPLLGALAGVPALTALTGMLMSRGVTNHPPLRVLSREDALG
jgi:putative ABC transport system permease protein